MTQVERVEAILHAVIAQIPDTTVKPAKLRSGVKSKQNSQFGRDEDG